MLSATWLDTFTTLAEVGHFTRAAQRLNMTQPGVSQHLRKLEAQLGQELIRREGKRFTLTPAGEAVLALGQSRRQEERALRAAIEVDSPDVGAVRIACSGSFAMLLYPRILELVAAAPGLRVDLEAAPRRVVQAGVLENRFDIGVLNRDPGHPRLDAVHLGDEDLCLVLPRAAGGAAVTFEDLAARGFVAHPDGFAYADELLSLNFPDAYMGADRLWVRTYVNQIGQILEPVARGIGYTILPRSGVDAFGRRERLRVMALQRPLHHGVWLVSRRGGPRNARSARLAALIREVAAGLAEA